MKKDLISLEVLDKVIVEIETILSIKYLLNPLEKKLVLEQLQLREAKNLQSQMVKDNLSNIMPGWVNKFLNDRNGEENNGQ